jgi:16S rRNA (guanine527-N7)-methyltransferase
MSSLPAQASGGHDALDGDPRLRSYFGTAWTQLAGFHELLTAHGVARGLIGPREPERLWDRHLLNSAAVVPQLDGVGSVVDLGSGAGLPGVVVAALRPDLAVTLLEPMERRCEWLGRVVSELGLTNARVLRGRAEDVRGEVLVDAVVTRAVGSMDKLYRWSGPLIRTGGVLVALKGERAAEEVEAAGKAARSSGFARVQVLEVATLDGASTARLVVAHHGGRADGGR